MRDDTADLSGHDTPTVLVVGGGLAGLALAARLDQHGVAPAVVEQAAAWRETGYGIGLWRDGLDVLETLGCHDAVRERAATPDGFAIRAAGGELLRRAAPRSPTIRRRCRRSTAPTFTSRSAASCPTTRSGWTPSRRRSTSAGTASR